VSFRVRSVSFLISPLGWMAALVQPSLSGRVTGV